MTIATMLSVNFHQLRSSLGYTGSFKLRLPSRRSLSNAVAMDNMFQHKTIKGGKLERKITGRGYKDSKFMHDKGRSTTLSSAESGILEIRSDHCTDPSQTIVNHRIFDWPAVFIVFDIETTGFSRENDRIIEIAFRDLTGGINSTFQSLVNPETAIKNSFVHRISQYMVSKPSVPRMRDLIPILLKYVESRKIAGKQIVFVAHNGRTFDFPFFIKEFQRCSCEVPSDWLFLDTLPLAKKLAKLDGSKLDKCSLEALRIYYNIPLMGEAHRAMQDVTTLSMVLQRLSFELKISAMDLMQTTYTVSDFDATKKDNGATKSSSL